MLTYMLIRHKVRDFGIWKDVFDSNRSLRIKNGLDEKFVFQGETDPHEIILLFEVKDLGKAEEFSRSPELLEKMEQSGVVDRPDIYFLHDLPGAHAAIPVRSEDEIEELKRIEEVYTEPMDKEVEIEFVYLAPEAKEVYLAGNFNNWEGKTLPMNKNKRGQWKASIRLLPGRYEYRYFVDGSWVIDKQCSEVVVDNAGLTNCILDVAPKMAA